MLSAAGGLNEPTSLYHRALKLSARITSAPADWHRDNLLLKPIPRLLQTSALFSINALFALAKCPPAAINLQHTERRASSASKNFQSKYLRPPRSKSHFKSACSSYPHDVWIGFLGRLFCLFVCLLALESGWLRVVGKIFIVGILRFLNWFQMD